MPDEGPDQTVTQQEAVTMPADDTRNVLPAFEEARQGICTLQFWLEALRLLAMLADAFAD
jgi:hypothetical protein